MKSGSSVGVIRWPSSFLGGGGWLFDNAGRLHRYYLYLAIVLVLDVRVQRGVALVRPSAGTLERPVLGSLIDVR